jgi:hypothetical protein
MTAGDPIMSSFGSCRAPAWLLHVGLVGVVLLGAPLLGVLHLNGQAPAVQAPGTQAPAPGRAGGAAGRQGGGAAAGGALNGIAPVPFADRTGFESMFNGTSLTGTGSNAAFQTWDGDPRLWRVEGGIIVGESTADKPVNPNSFLIWRGGTPGDFELKAELRMNSTNSGIQYRSKMLPAGPSGHAWRLGGYQMDLDFNNEYSGQLYEEAGRGFLTNRGTISTASPDGTKGQIGALEPAAAVAALFKPNDWNQFHIIARGATLIHIMNGHVSAIFVDDDLKARAMAGLIGFQMHAGPPMKLEIRNVAIKLR